MTAREPLDRPTAAQVWSTLADSSQSAGQPTGAPAGPPPGSVDGDTETVSWSSPMTPFLTATATDRRGPSAHRRRMLYSGAGAVLALAAAAVWLITPGDTDAPAATPSVPPVTRIATAAIPTVPNPMPAPKASAARVRPQSLPRTVAATVVRSAVPSTSPAPSTSYSVEVYAGIYPHHTTEAHSDIDCHCTADPHCVTDFPAPSAVRPPVVKGPTTPTTVGNNGNGNGKGKPPKKHGR